MNLIYYGIVFVINFKNDNFCIDDKNLCYMIVLNLCTQITFVCNIFMSKKVCVDRKKKEKVYLLMLN